MLSDYPDTDAYKNVPLSVHHSKAGWDSGEVPDDTEEGKPPCDPCDPSCENTPLKVGNPITIHNGNKFEEAVDFRLPTSNKLSLNFERFYNSQSSITSTVGYGWSASFTSRLEKVEEAITYLKITDDSGRAAYFPGHDMSFWVGAFGEKSRVEELVDGYVWYHLDGSQDTFDLTGKLLWKRDANGLLQSMTYDVNGLLQSVTDEATGLVLNFSYNANGLLDHISGPVTSAIQDGIWVSFGYDANDNLTSTTYADGSGFQYEYNDPNDIHNLTAKKNQAGHVLATWSYDNLDRAVTNYTPDGRGVDITYVTEDTVEVTDAYGETRIYGLQLVDGARRVVSLSDASGCQSCGGTAQPVRYAYDNIYNVTEADSRMRIIEKEYANGRIIQYFDYDAKGNPGMVIKNVGTTDERTHYYTYHPETGAKITASTMSLLTGDYKTTTWDYDNDGNTIANENPTRLLYRKIDKGYTLDSAKQVVAYEHITAYTYNAKGQVTSVNGPLAGDLDLTTLAYNATTGNLLSVTSPLVGTTTYGNYDAARNAQLITDPNGIQTTLVYDGKNRVISSTTNGITSTRTYNLAGDLATVTDAMGRSVTYDYDSTYGRLTKVTDPSGNYQQTGYDAQGNATQINAYDPGGVSHLLQRYSYQHPTLPGKLWKVINPDDSETVYDYDSMGNVTSIIDPLGRIYSYGYDLNGRRTSTEEPGLVITNYGYDNAGNLIKVTDAENKDTTYDVDDLGRVLASHSPDAGTISFSYTEAGQLAAKTDAMGVTTSYSYDVAGRRTGIIYADTSQNVTYTYDQGTNGKGRLTTVAGPDSTILYTYNDQGLLASEIKTMGLVDYVTTYSYDDSGLLTSVSYPWGLTATYSHDAAGQVTDVTVNHEATAYNIMTAASYLPFGPLDGMTLGNGIQVSRSYDQSYQLTGITDSTVLELSYSHDLSGKITAIANNQDLLRDQQFAYDDNDHLTQAQGIYGTLDYTYDMVGNRQTKSVDGLTDTYSYISGTNRIQAVTTATAEQKIFVHDQAGRAISIPDAGSQPVDTSYVYDDKELRIKKEADSQSTIYHYDLSGNLLAETNPDGTLIRAYIYGAGLRLATMVPDGVNFNTYWHHNDHLGTPQKLTDSSGAVVWSADYLPFGKAIVDPGSTVDNNIRFPGQYYDSETGLHYNWHRYYDPATGRYMTPDPIGLDGGINLYAYVDGDPINWIDPYGLYHWNKKPPYTVPVTGQTKKNLECLEECLKCETGDSNLDMLLTGGAEKSGHSTNSHHGKGTAVDVAGPKFNPISDPAVKKCALKCGFNAGLFEQYPNKPNKTHWHLQQEPGNGVPSLRPNLTPRPYKRPVLRPSPFKVR
ncbi:MAG: RHS domain-containing protein [Proteobacteria bacterium]|nr:RHS domain-containing protein [Pseudomonadota bacterium]